LYLLKVIASENETTISSQSPIIGGIIDFLESYNALKLNHKMSLFLLSGDLKTRLDDFNSYLLSVLEVIRENREEISIGIQDYCALKEKQSVVEDHEEDRDALKREAHELYKKVSGIVTKISSLIYDLQEAELVQKAGQKRSRNLDKLLSVDEKHCLKFVSSIKAIAEQVSRPFYGFLGLSGQSLEENASLFEQNICALKGLERALDLIDAQ
jgi:hypothetical protein